nr:PREDICTED: arrestin domain-containing protein 2-like isoform X2 [Linepithema humile]
MPSLKIFRIEFDRPDGIYVPGEIVSGNVIIDLANEKIVRDDGKVHIPVGLNKYSFHIKLPCNIPCSFEHVDGHIRYTIKAVIDRPWRFNHECKAAFTVITAYDLNMRHQQCIGICDELSKNFSSLCCFDDGSMNVRIKIPTTGFVPGQWIETTLELKNITNLKKISAKLMQSIDLHATTAKKRCYSTVALMENSEPFAKYDVIMSRLYIPPIPPSELEFCSIIHLNYILQITFYVSGMHCNSTKKYPVLIGTIPLRPAPSAPEISPSPHEPQFISKNKIMPMPSELDIASITSYPDSPPTNDSFNAPPSYEECCTNKAYNIKDQDESNYVHGADEPFAPRYPVFKFSTPYSPEKY